jgi:2-(3-amino-3-carboxypropyl)histidine synthase
MYNLELNKAMNEIKKSRAKTVLIQLPDGLKPRAKEISDYLGKKTKAEFLIWADSCFGACDVPLEAKNLNVDLIIQFGHSEWKQ